jgi:hypothetical protein
LFFIPVRRGYEIEPRKKLARKKPVKNNGIYEEKEAN